MVNSQIPQEWLESATQELSFAKDILGKGLTYYDQACFHSHQAAEKYLKAYVIANQLDFRKIHDLTSLVDTCSGKDNAFETLREKVAKLNPYYIGTRYPGISEPATSQDAGDAIKIAEEISTLVKSKL